MTWFDCATHKPISANTGGKLGPNLGLVLHHAVANGSLFTFFNNPASQVSAHFWVSKAGDIEQYVDSDTVAWHAMTLNGRYCGVETEGCVSPPYAEPMTDAMVNALGRLYAEGMARHGWANALANADGEPGFGYHRMAVNTSCPCDVRLAKRQAILDIATGVPSPLPPETEDMDNITYVTFLYRFLLYRAPDPGGLSTWVGELDKGASRAEVWALFQNGAEGVAALNFQRKSMGMSEVTAP